MKHVPATFGVFLLAAAVSASVHAQQVAAPADPTLSDTPTFSDFSVTWRKEMAPQWRRQHRDSVDATFAAHLLTEFGDRAVGSITKHLRAVEVTMRSSREQPAAAPSRS